MADDLRISASDGYALGATVYGAQATGPVVIVNSATGVRHRYYSRFAAWLAEQNATVISYDYRGIGLSRPHSLRGFTARMRDWGQLDFEGVLRFVDKRFEAARPRAVIGHSIGGQLLGFADSNATLSRAVTVASQSGHWSYWPGLARKAGLIAIWYALMPAVSSVVGYLPGRLGIGEDLPKGVALEWARWGRSQGFFTSDPTLVDGFKRVAIPIQAWSFSDDLNYAPKAAVDWLHDQFPNATIDRQHLAPQDIGAKAIDHFGAFNIRFKDTLWPRFAAGLGVGRLTATAP